ncbi:hypothetical protein C5E16_04025 [Clavibacter michiganensis]|uniref:Uncharacterized protein n=1 Tax=Clavibacter michiganensis TaxID=28447 RepID=A0A2S5VWJ3_9MICO|nr:hypothetical protein C5E16_04025 [Clavibacter michiganensis]
MGGAGRATGGLTAVRAPGSIARRPQPGRSRVGRRRAVRASAAASPFVQGHPASAARPRRRAGP